MSLYPVWDRLGRPVTPARPIEDFVGKLKAAYPAGAGQFGWYADESHYPATPPGDHTPFSAEAWPLPDPRWVVFASDVMNTGVGGAGEAQKLFDYWLAEAKAGRMPWLKYLIWRATIYDVRYGWRPQPNADHFDHIHVSARTDFEHYSLGGWSVVPGKPSGGGAMPYLVNIKGQSDVWETDGLRRRRLAPGFAALYNQLKARLGEPFVVANEAELTYLAGPVDTELAGGDGSGPTAAEIAQAVNDDAAARLAG